MTSKDIYVIAKDFFKKRGELVILFFIIAIAGVIAYSYFSSGNRNSRNTLRYAHLLSIGDNLKLFYTKNNTYPLPDGAVGMTASGKNITYQGYMGETTFAEINAKKVQDPLGESVFRYLMDYTYVTDEKKQKFQLMAWYETSDEKTYNPITKRTPFVYGDDVGVVIENKTSRPIQETKLSVDILQTPSPYSIYLNNTSILVGDKNQLKDYFANTQFSLSKTCLDMKLSGWKESGYYYINPLLGGVYEKYSKPIQVYCEMESDGGGWTRLYYKTGKESCLNDKNNYNSLMIEKLFTKDFAVSDQLETLKSEGSWILNDVDLKYKDFSFQKMANVANCMTPTGEQWSTSYNKGYVSVIGTLGTMGTWNQMFYGCDYKKSIGEKFVLFNIGGLDKYNMTGDFIHTLCNNYSDKENSITSRWDWDNTRVMWVR